MPSSSSHSSLRSGGGDEEEQQPLSSTPIATATDETPRRRSRPDYRSLSLDDESQVTNENLEHQLPQQENNKMATAIANSLASSATAPTTTTSTPSYANLLMGRILLLVVSFLYGTLNVTLRGVYAQEGPPSASVLSTVRGWLAALCFVPLVLWNQNKLLGHNYPHPHNDKPELVAQQEPEEDIVDAAVSNSSGNNNIVNEEEPLPSFQPQPQQQQSSQQHIQQQHSQRPLGLVALELAVWNFGAQALVNISLLWISGARAAFLTETSVVITPVLSAAFGHRVKVTVWWACAVAMLGLIVLSDSAEGKGAKDADSEGGSSGGGIGHFGFGDLLVLCGAFCWSCYLYRLSQCGGAYPEVDLQAWKTVILAGLYTCWCLGSYWHLRATTSNDDKSDPEDNSSPSSLWPGYASIVTWLLLLYSALGPGTVADLLQQKGQAYVAAAEANVLLSLEPVFTSILGLLLLGEMLTIQEVVGGGLLLVAAICATR